MWYLISINKYEYVFKQYGSISEKLMTVWTPKFLEFLNKKIMVLYMVDKKKIKYFF